jgi:hypothetical protein
LAPAIHVSKPDWRAASWLVVRYSKRRGRDRIVSNTEPDFEDVFGPPPPRPTECPDCGSHSILPICYGFPGPEMAEAGKRGEIVLGGCIFAAPSWYCKECFNGWPEDPPPEGLHGQPEWQKKHLAETAAKYASITADAALPPQPDEPAVENYWQRPDGRMIFLVRFPWGKLRIEKQLHLVPLGGTPVYDRTGGWPPMEVDYGKARRQAMLAAIRFERRPPA